MNKNDSLKKALRYIPFILLSSFLMSISMNSFSIPAKIYPAGVMGICRLVSQLLEERFNIVINYSIFLLPLNCILAIFVYKFIGKLFTFLSLLQVFCLSIFSQFMPRLIVIDDMLLLAVFGGIVLGLSSSIALLNNASTGGTDFISIYLSTKYKKSMWNVIFLINSLLILTEGLLFGWEVAFYSIIYQFCSTQVVNRLHKRYTSETITIITSKPEEVSKAIFESVRHGITEISARGAYSHTETTMLYTVVNGYQTSEVIKAIQSVDDRAFINVQHTKVVYGNYYQKPLD